MRKHIGQEPDVKRMTVDNKLSKPQQDLLDEIRDSSTGGLWISGHNYARTAESLRRLGLVKITDHAWQTNFYEVAE